MKTLDNCIHTGQVSSIKSYIMSLSKYAVEQNINPVLIMSSYVATHIKNANPAGGDEWRNACGNRDIFTLHMAVKMLEMLSATT